MLLILLMFLVGPTSTDSNITILDSINKVRVNGCTCGKQKMKPVQPLTWNKMLYKSALDHAQDMSKNNFFTHYSKDGKNVSERIEAFGYNWEVVGENIGQGHKTFDEVLKHWIKSYSHCIMLMDPKVEEVAVAEYMGYWVQHFGKELPKGAIPNKK